MDSKEKLKQLKLIQEQRIKDLRQQRYAKQNIDQTAKQLAGCLIIIELFICFIFPPFIFVFIATGIWFYINRKRS